MSNDLAKMVKRWLVYFFVIVHFLYILLYYSRRCSRSSMSTLSIENPHSVPTNLTTPDYISVLGNQFRYLKKVSVWLKNRSCLHRNQFLIFCSPYISQKLGNRIFLRSVKGFEISWLIESVWIRQLYQENYQVFVNLSTFF